MTPSGMEPATFRFVAQRLNHCATAVSLLPDCFNLIVVSSTCFEHVIAHHQEDSYMGFYGISFMHPYKQSAGWQDVLDVSSAQEIL